jgi:hypothetical protein
MKKAIIGSVALVVYVNIVPYACRIWRGLDWVAQYLPDQGKLVSGLLLFGGFASLAAIPLVVSFLLRKWIPITFVVSIIVATALLSFWHHDYDLASDAQAAIGLAFIPIFAAIITGVVAAIAGVLEFLIRRRKPVANQASHATSEPAPRAASSSRDG